MHVKYDSAKHLITCLSLSLISRDVKFLYNTKQILEVNSGAYLK